MHDEDLTMADLMSEVDKSMERISNGDLVTGVVVANNGEELIVNIGHMADGVVPKLEVDFEEGATIGDIQVGDELSLYVLKYNDGEGNILLSKKRADAELVWDEAKQIMETKKVVPIKVKEVVKGGVIGLYKGVRCFVPYSQIGLFRTEEPEKLVGSQLDVHFTEIKEDGKGIVASGRSVAEKKADQVRERAFNTLEEGQILTGTVKRLQPFGAFVDIGGIDGLIHLNDLSWKRVKKPEEVVQVGDVIKVSIIKIDEATKKIGLRLADVVDNPWTHIRDYFKEGDTLTGTVTRLQPFGAFVEVIDGIEGLVHISQIAEERISKPQEKLALGESVSVKVLTIDPEEQKLSLSIKEALAFDDVDYEEFMDEEEENTTLGDLFGDALKKLKF